MPLSASDVSQSKRRNGASFVSCNPRLRVMFLHSLDLRSNHEMCGCYESLRVRCLEIPRCGDKSVEKTPLAF
jgi:hypothetical protein